MFNRIGALILLSAFIANCSFEDTRTEIVERWSNGAKKRVITYEGEGDNERMLVENIYSAEGFLFNKIDHVGNDTLGFHDLHKPSNFPHIGKWKWVKSKIDSSGNITNIRPGKKYSPIVQEIDSSLVIKNTVFQKNEPIIFKRYLYEYDSNLYLKFSSYEGSSNFGTNLQLDDEGKFLKVEKSSYSTDESPVSIGTYFQNKVHYSKSSDTLIVSYKDSLREVKEHYLPFRDSTYVKENLKKIAPDEGVDNLPLSNTNNTITLTILGIDQMKFAVRNDQKPITNLGDEIYHSDDLYELEQINSRPNQELVIKLKTISDLPETAMAHNFVLLKSDTDIPSFVTASMRHKENNYIPQDEKKQIILNSDLVGGGESDTITFSAPSTPGEYTFVCTFPGHYIGGMKGVLKVEDE